MKLHVGSELLHCWLFLFLPIALIRKNAKTRLWSGSLGQSLHHSIKTSLSSLPYSHTVYLLFHLLLTNCIFCAVSWMPGFGGPFFLSHVLLENLLKLNLSRSSNPGFAIICPFSIFPKKHQTACLQNGAPLLTGIGVACRRKETHKHRSWSGPSSHHSASKRIFFFHSLPYDLVFRNLHFVLKTHLNFQHFVRGWTETVNCLTWIVWNPSGRMFGPRKKQYFVADMNPARFWPILSLGQKLEKHNFWSTLKFSLKQYVAQKMVPDKYFTCAAADFSRSSTKHVFVDVLIGQVTTCNPP